MSVDTPVTTLSAAFDDYPHTLPLKRGEINSPHVAFTFSDIKPANRFFKPMVREPKFDVSEMAIATYVQAKAYGKPLVLIPATMMGRLQHGTILCNAARAVTPDELAGKGIGVRCYSEKPAGWGGCSMERELCVHMAEGWVRAILENDYDVQLDKMHWVTFEDGHVAEYHEPQRVERAGADKNLLKMLREGELDAAIYGADLPNDPTLKSLIPDAEAAAQSWYARHNVVPINHMVVVTEKLAKSNPQTVKEIYRLLLQAKSAVGLPKAGAIDFLPFGLEACRPALQTIITYALQQRLIPRKIEVEDLFDDTTRALA